MHALDNSRLINAIDSLATNAQALNDVDRNHPPKPEDVAAMTRMLGDIVAHVNIIGSILTKASKETNTEVEPKVVATLPAPHRTEAIDTRLREAVND